MAWIGIAIAASTAVIALQRIYFAPPNAAGHFRQSA